MQAAGAGSGSLGKKGWMESAWLIHVWFFFIASMMRLEPGNYLGKKKVMSRREVRTYVGKWKEERVNSLSLSFCLLCLLSQASLAVHVGLWNGVDWMVDFVPSHPSIFLTAVTKLIGIIRTEISIAPDVELMTGHRDWSEWHKHCLLD